MSTAAIPKAIGGTRSPPSTATAGKVAELAKPLENLDALSVSQEAAILAAIRRLVDSEPENHELDDWREFFAMV